MEQSAGIQNAHSAAMNSLMSKYTDKLMSTEGAKRAREMLEDNVGTELIMAGLQSGKLGEMGKHLLKKALGKASLRKPKDVADAVEAFRKNGHQGVLDHFAKKGKAMTDTKLKEIFPDGLSDKLKENIRNTYGSAAEASNDLGGRLKAGLKAKHEELQAKASSTLDRAGNVIEEARPSPAFSGAEGGVRDRVAERLLPHDSGGRFASKTGDGNPFEEEDGSAGGRVIDMPRDAPIERKSVSTTPEIVNESPMEARIRSLTQKYTYDDLKNIQRGGRFSSLSDLPKGVSRTEEIPDNLDWSQAVETAKANPKALGSSVAKAVDNEGFRGSPEEAQMIDNIRQKSATAAQLTASAQQRSASELEQSANARRLAPENILRPETQQVARPVEREPVNFAAEAEESALRAPAFRNEPMPFFEE
tara:strand:+ start:167 stop:1420 length:1254 start_codon:yes stop_codon:yes gene_type:complete